MCKVGIVFQKYNQEELSLLDSNLTIDPIVKNYEKRFMNVEMSMNGFNSIDDLILFLNKKWNNRKKLLQLLPIGFIFKLGTTINNCESEYSEFKKEWRNIEQERIAEHYNEIVTGTYWVTSSNDFPEQSIEITYCSTETLDEIVKDSVDYEWKYVIYFDGNKFKIIKENKLDD